MENILYIIHFCSSLLTNNFLSFGSYRFNLLSILVSFAAIGLVSFAIRKIFD